MAIDVSTKQTLEGNEVVLYSHKQAARFDALTQSDTDTKKTKIVKQFSDGGILLHKFVMIDGKYWMGYSVLLGKRGGEITNHNCFVEENRDGSLSLVVRVRN